MRGTAERGEERGRMGGEEPHTHTGVNKDEVCR